MNLWQMLGIKQYNHRQCIAKKTVELSLNFKRLETRWPLRMTAFLFYSWNGDMHQRTCIPDWPGSSAPGRAAVLKWLLRHPVGTTGLSLGEGNKGKGTESPAPRNGLLESLLAILVAESGAALSQSPQPHTGVQDPVGEATTGPTPWLDPQSSTCSLNAINVLYDRFSTTKSGGTNVPLAIKPTSLGP